MPPPSLSEYTSLDLIHNGRNSQVYRAQRRSDASPVVLKFLNTDYPTPEQVRRYRQEYHLAHRLNLSNVIKAHDLEEWQQTLVIVFEDFGGVALKDWLKTQANGIAVEDFIAIALKMTDALVQLHSQNVIHKDINPSNIVLNPDTMQLKAIDLGISTQLSRETPGLQSLNKLEGTLFYISPEQTGRMNRSLDYRTDFYSLGVTFYEMLTGALPFTSEDPTELVHCHIAQEPKFTDTHSSTAVPEVLQSIVRKLMAKNAEDRYQSAWGLRADLEQFANQPEAKDAVSGFSLGQMDFADRLQIPQRLYGREQEVGQLLTAFDRIADQPQSELLLVTGYSGIGKTELVRSLYGPITAKRGNFIAGKFDQIQRNIPYSALVDAFAGLVSQLLSDSDADLQRWRQRLLDALGSMGKAVIDVIPDVELITGAQPSLPSLSGSEAQNRFNLVFQDFIQAFCSPEHPLTIFLDDMQWADSATLNLLEHLLAKNQLQHCLLIFAYRDNEVLPGHPLMLAINQLKKSECKTETIVLTPLSLDHVSDLIADTLHRPRSDVQALAELVFHKAQGNPFFTKQLLKTLFNESLLAFSHQDRQWHWDLEEIDTLGLSDNVVDLMVSQLQQLPSLQQRHLAMAAFLGNEFELETLSLVTNCSTVILFSSLKAALDDGLLVARSQPDENLLIHEYQFGHDRIQQAAYALIDEDRRDAVHLSIGQMLRKTVKTGPGADSMFDVMNHLNHGISLIGDPDERLHMAELNLEAGNDAIRSVAFSLALSYFEAGIAFLPDSPWESQYTLTLALHEAAAEAAALSHDYERAARLFDRVLTRANTPLDKAKTQRVKMRYLIGQDRLLEAIESAQAMLRELNFDLATEPGTEEVTEALWATQAKLAGRSVESLADLPVMSDPYQRAVVLCLSEMEVPCFHLRPNLYRLIVTKQVQTFIDYGNLPLCCPVYSLYGLILNSLADDIDTSYRFGQLALAMTELPETRHLWGRISHVVSHFINCWKHPLHDITQDFITAHQSCMKYGDALWAAYASHVHCEYAFVVGHPLAQLEETIAHYTASSERIHQDTAVTFNAIFWQAVLNLQDKAEDPCVLTGEALDERALIQHSQDTENQTSLFLVFFVKQYLAYLFGNYDQAQNCAAQTEKYLIGVQGNILNLFFYYQDALIELRSTPSDLSKVDRILVKLKNWTRYAPNNHQHRVDLVEAERHRVLGRKLEAIEQYDKAIAGAKQNRFINDEALANELAANFYLDWGKAQLARGYLFEAHHCYLHWGASAKVRLLEEQHPFLVPSSRTKTIPFVSDTQSVSNGGEYLDLAAMMKASGAIASEIELNKLLQTLIKILLENAGAQIGCLLLPKGEQTSSLEDFMIAIHQDEAMVSIDSELDGFDRLPQSILRSVVRTQETLLINSEAEARRFESDPYIQATNPLSVICFALVNQGTLVGIVYLENTIAKGAFTQQRVELLKLLSGQAAIALTNARLYDQVKKAEQLLTDYSRELELEVKARTSELQQANQELQRMAMTDGLTQVANRRYFEQRLHHEWSRLMREKQPLSLILFDVDYFKLYNDCYGHQSGDDCLKLIAAAAEGAVRRSYDLLARYGGEEFIVILPNTTREGAINIARNIQRNVREQGVPHERSEIDKIVSISLGLACRVPDRKESPEILIAEADQALYTAKQEGRDRYSFAPG